jgi:hypothetical protein
MGLLMHRIVALAMAAGLIATGLGCKHVAGTCDCSYHPDNAVITPPGQPYPALGQPIPGTAVPEKMPAPAPTPMGK